MSIQLRTINLTLDLGHATGSITRHQDDPGLDVPVLVEPQFDEPGDLVTLDEDSAELEDWNVFVYEGDRIVRTLILTAEEPWNRERAVRTVMAAHQMEEVEEDPEAEALMWRFAGGEITLDELQQSGGNLTPATGPAGQGTAP